VKRIKEIKEKEEEKTPRTKLIKKREGSRKMRSGEEIITTALIRSLVGSDELGK